MRSDTLPRASKGGGAWRRRFDIASRTLAATFGGYLAASLCGAGLAVLLPMARPDAVVTATMLAFLVHAATAMWAFAARSHGQAWWVPLLPSGVLGLAAWLAARLGGAA